MKNGNKFIKKRKRNEKRDCSFGTGIGSSQRFNKLNKQNKPDKLNKLKKEERCLRSF